MTQYAHDLEEYELDDIDYEPWLSNRERRRKRRERRAAPPIPDPDVVSTMADPLDLEAGFRTTYQPSRHEGQWLLDSLRPFYEDSLITDVLSMVQGGKEASVYCCQAHPATGYELLAAKVYRPRKFRNLRNDTLYRAGREILTENGQAINARDQRIIRAIGKKTDFGVQVEHTSWLMHEYAALRTLYKAGADVPEPLAAHDNAVLMTYLGEPHRGAPTLHEVRLSPDEGPGLLAAVLRNVEMMLSHHLIHGDLSAYNILYWQGRITLIDFPQVVKSTGSPYAHDLLNRDVVRVCEYFQRQGVQAEAGAFVEELWYRYGKDILAPEEALGDLYLGPSVEPDKDAV